MSTLRRIGYLLGCYALILSQHLMAWLVLRSAGARASGLADSTFWTSPLVTALESPGIAMPMASLLLAWSLAVAALIGWLSLKAARVTGAPLGLVVLTLVPLVQVLAIAAIAILPSNDNAADRPDTRALQGIFAGAAIVVVAMVLSATTFGAYGWGLFVFTPMLAAFATALLANRDTDIGLRRSFGLAMAGLAVGSAGLIVFALEGIVCILMAAPLAAIAAIPGAALGRKVASVWHDPAKPFYSLAILPLIFALEAAIPPHAALETHVSVEIDAPAEAVWAALLSDAPVAGDPGLPGWGGLAYPMSGEMRGAGENARRIGHFSTGMSREVVTEWQENRVLAYRVVDQPPMMEEMSPYRRVHAPHVEGYFATGETRYVLDALPGGGTRLTLSSEHVLRIDPLPYWEPFARLAIRQNVDRVLADLKRKAERRR